MANRLTGVIIDCQDLEGTAEFWRQALGYEEANRGEGWVALRAPGADVNEVLLRAGGPQGNEFCVMPEIDPEPG